MKKEKQSDKEDVESVKDAYTSAKKAADDAAGCVSSIQQQIDRVNGALDTLGTPLSSPVLVRPYYLSSFITQFHLNLLHFCLSHSSTNQETEGWCG